MQPMVLKVGFYLSVCDCSSYTNKKGNEDDCLLGCCAA
jgi:hypothetical protein